jgi:GNAT superfamily N-acetyltransferase
MDPRIALLADRSEDAGTIARWQFEEWGPYVPGEDLEGRRRRLLGWAGRHHVPVTLVAVVDGRPVGSASVVDHDMPQPPQAWAAARPWVSGVYVVPDQRKTGLGPALVAGCEEQALALGHDVLYLYTGPVTATKFYEPMGWRARDRLAYMGDDIVVMSKEL